MHKACLGMLTFILFCTVGCGQLASKMLDFSQMGTFSGATKASNIDGQNVRVEWAAAVPDYKLLNYEVLELSEDGSTVLSTTVVDKSQTSFTFSGQTQMSRKRYKVRAKFSRPPYDSNDIEVQQTLFSGVQSASFTDVSTLKFSFGTLSASDLAKIGSLKVYVKYEGESDAQLVQTISTIPSDGNVSGVPIDPAKEISQLTVHMVDATTDIEDLNEVNIAAKRIELTGLTATNPKILRVNNRAHLVGKCLPGSGTFTVTPPAGVLLSDSSTITCNSLGELHVVLQTTDNTDWALWSGSKTVEVSHTVGGNTYTAQATIGVSSGCPTNYVGVEGDENYATYGFCVAKFEMKATSDGSTSNSSLLVGGDGTLGGSSIYSPIAASRPDGTPWVNVSLANASSACTALGSVTGNSGTYRLIANYEWQTIGRSIEATAWNWSGNAVGSGKLNRGHSNNTISGTAIADGLAFASTLVLAASSATVPFSEASASAFYVGKSSATSSQWNTLGATPAGGTEQKRVHKVTRENGDSGDDIVWDLAGNAWEYVSDSRTGFLDPADFTVVAWQPAASYSGTSFDTVFDGRTYRQNFGPAGSAYTPTNQNIGNFKGGSTGVMLRGGYWAENGQTGLYATYAGYSSGAINTVGFRCVWVP